MIKLHYYKYTWDGMAMDGVGDAWQDLLVVVDGVDRCNELKYT